MKKIIIPLFIIGLMFGFAGSASAIEVRTNSNINAPINAAGRMKMEDKNDNQRNDNRLKNLENRSERFQQVITKLTSIHDRLIKVTERIESRIKKLDSESFNTDTSAKLVAKAREELRLAAISTSEASVSLKAESDTSTTINAENYRAVYAKTFTNIKTTKEHLIKAHRNLVEAITNLKQGQKSETGTSGSIKVR